MRTVRRGMPLMRPLFFEQPFHRQLWSDSGSYFWGDSFLISPIVHPKVETKSIYFPETANFWFDFYSDKKYMSGTVHSIEVSAEHIPTFVKVGSFIPMIDAIQSTREYHLRHFYLHYYHDDGKKEAKGRLYHDDGKTANAYQKQQFEQFLFEARFEGNTLRITIEKQIGKHFDTYDNNGFAASAQY